MKKILIIFTLMMIMSSSLALADNRFNQISQESFNQKTTLPVEGFKETDAVSCEDVLTSNTVLTSDLTCAGDGLIIGANGIVLDCDGHSIAYGDSEEGDGVQIVGYNNVEVRNCDIIRGSASGDSNIGVKLQDAPNTLIEFNNISTKGFVNYCITITDSGNSIIQYNSIYHNEDGTRGIILGGNQENIQIKNNQITSLDNVPLSIEINSDSIYTNITNNVIDSEFDAIKLGTIGSHPEGTIIEGNTITASGYDLIINANIDDVTLIDQPIDKYDINHAKIQIKKTGLGEVWFDERMTVSGDNLDEDVKIEDNNISIDIINKPAFNVSGHIILYEPTTIAFGPQYIPLKNGIKCNNPFHLNVCTDFEYENETETFSFNVSEMDLEYKIEGTYIPLPWIIVDPSSGPVGSNVDVNISWLSGNVGDSFTIMFDTYIVESFNYPDVGDARSFIIEIEVPSIPAGEYDVSLEGRTDVRGDDFIITATTSQEQYLEEVIVEKRPKREKIVKTVVKKENVQKTETKIVERIIKYEPFKKTTLSSNNKAFYSFYI